MKTYIFASDPHGTGKKWIDNVKQMQSIYPTAITIFGGDYIDGRKYSAETLNFVQNQTKTKKNIALLGNHEQMLLDFVSSNNELDLKLNYDLWKENGGKSTIKSLTGRNWSYQQSAYQLNYHHQTLINWLRTLKPLYITPEIIFIHAGLDLEKENPIQETSKSDMMWLREDYWWEPDNGLRQTHYYWHHNPLRQAIVSGHTPTCLLYGRYDDDLNPIKGNLNDESFNCPVKTIKYPNEAPRIFTDGGCHSQLKNHNGNIVAITQSGNILNIIN
jgi:serine/threonine protein phosphatase 1